MLTLFITILIIIIVVIVDNVPSLHLRRTHQLDLLRLVLLVLLGQLELLAGRFLLRLETDRLLFQSSLQFLILQSVLQKRTLFGLNFRPKIIFLARGALLILFHIDFFTTFSNHLPLMLKILDSDEALLSHLGRSEPLLTGRSICPSRG